MNKKLWIGLLLLSVLSVSSCQRQEETLLLSEDKTKQEESVQEPEKKEDSGERTGCPGGGRRPAADPRLPVRCRKPAGCVLSEGRGAAL